MRLARHNPIPALQQLDRDLARAVEIAYPWTVRPNPPSDFRHLEAEQGRFLLKIYRERRLLKANRGRSLFKIPRRTKALEVDQGRVSLNSLVMRSSLRSFNANPYLNSLVVRDSLRRYVPVKCNLYKDESVDPCFNNLMLSLLG